MVGTILNRLGGRRILVGCILVAALRLGTGGLGAPAENIEVVDAVTHTDYPVLTQCLVQLHTRHTEVQHTGLAIFCLHRHIIVECDIHTQ